LTDKDQVFLREKKGEKIDFLERGELALSHADEEKGKVFSISRGKKKKKGKKRISALVETREPKSLSQKGGDRILFAGERPKDRVLQIGRMKKGGEKKKATAL